MSCGLAACERGKAWVADGRGREPHVGVGVVGVVPREVVRDLTAKHVGKRRVALKRHA